MQLLVNKKLFIVVIAIDSRYVTLSLEEHYKVLRPDRSPSGMDYLEKIIQLPYQVPVGVGMENYILEQMGKLKGNVKDEVDQNEGLPSGSRSNQEENDESNTDTRSEGVPLDSNTNLSTKVIPQIELLFTEKDHQNSYKSI